MNEKYDRIIQTAIRLFIENGIHNTPTSMIAKEAQVATGTLFHYFESKEALINAVYINSKESLTNALVVGLDKEKDIIKTAKRMFINSLKWSVENPQSVKFYQTYGNSNFIASITRDEAQEKFGFLKEFIVQGQNQGYIKPIPVELVFNAIYGIMSQMMNFFSENPDRIKNQRDIEDVFTLLWDTMKR